eukprot:Awhi_evm1s4437
MKHPRYFPSVVIAVMSIAMFVYLSFGAVCYLAFGVSVTDQMTEKMALFAKMQGGIWPFMESLVRS